MNNFRLAIGAVGFLGALIAPPWIPLICIVVLAVRFRAWEAIILGCFMDFLWLPELSLGSLPLFTLASIIIVWGLEPLRLEILH